MLFCLLAFIREVKYVVAVVYKSLWKIRAVASPTNGVETPTGTAANARAASQLHPHSLSAIAAAASQLLLWEETQGGVA